MKELKYHYDICYVIYLVMQLLINKLILTITFIERNGANVSMKVVSFESLFILIKT